MAEKTPKVISMGLRSLATQVYDDETGTYTGEYKVWNGHSEITITFSQTSEKLASGDDPAWDEVLGPVTATVKIKFYDIPLNLYEQLFTVEYSESNGVLIGEETQTKWLGIVADNVLKDGSTNRTVLFKARLSLPEITHTTMSEDENSIQELELEGNAYPVFYDKADGTTGRRTCQIMNSKTHETAYANYSTVITPPVEIG